MRTPGFDAKRFRGLETNDEHEDIDLPLPILNTVYKVLLFMAPIPRKLPLTESY
jgi:hypothetical protein